MWIKSSDLSVAVNLLRLYRLLPMFKEKNNSIKLWLAFLLSPIITSPPRLNIAFPAMPPPCSDPQRRCHPRLAPTANPTRQYYVHGSPAPRHWSDERRVVRRRQGLLHQSDESHGEPVMPVSPLHGAPVQHCSLRSWLLLLHSTGHYHLCSRPQFHFSQSDFYVSYMIASSMMHAAVWRSHSINLFWMPIIWVLRELRCIASAFCLLSFLVPIYKDVIIWVITA
jgi:hypothetical protein